MPPSDQGDDVALSQKKLAQKRAKKDAKRTKAVARKGPPPDRGSGLPPGILAYNEIPEITSDPLPQFVDPAGFDAGLDPEEAEFLAIPCPMCRGRRRAMLLPTEPKTPAVE